MRECGEAGEMVLMKEGEGKARWQLFQMAMGCPGVACSL